MILFKCFCLWAVVLIVAAGDSSKFNRTINTSAFKKPFSSFPGCNAKCQSNAPWGIVRVTDLDKCETDYKHCSGCPHCVIIYVIDTGLGEKCKSEFGNRLRPGVNFAPGLPRDYTEDQNGHGTHVAATAAGNTFGIARDAYVTPVRVFGPEGATSYSTIAKAIKWAITDCKAQKCEGGTNCNCVINMSLGGSDSPAIRELVYKAYCEGLAVICAAGNEFQPSDCVSPANAKGSFTVAAHDIHQSFAYFSNYGGGVDCIAPGVNITSCYYQGGTWTISGTSMATPHVAGIAAYIWCWENLKGPGEVYARLLQLSRLHKVNIDITKPFKVPTVNRMCFRDPPCD